jgi:3-deoxy-7-phosphoheptulonate synthase
MTTVGTTSWSADSWRGKPAAQDIAYPDRDALEASLASLRRLPPLVTSWEIERLREHLGEAQAGKRFVLMGGDCAETIDECRPELVTSKLKILLQMSLVLVHSVKKPVVRVGRFAGQYAKPRSSATETRVVEGSAVTLPSYFGDLVNRAPFTAAARTPDPRLLISGYQHAALTINFVRALVDGGFADLHHPEYWDLSFFKNATLPPGLRVEYERMTRNLADGLRFMEALGEKTVDDLTRVEFFTSHEGLNLHYESAQTRTVPRRDGHYCLTTHLPWIGERTRALDGAHVEFFRGVRNPVGVKLGAKAKPEEVGPLIDALNPRGEAGKLVLISRPGAPAVDAVLPALVAAAKEHSARTGRGALWLCDPMHGNTVSTASGLKTRRFEDIQRELERTIAIHEAQGSTLAGVHFELTGEDVTECVGGASGVTEEGLSTNYSTACDPRLNYQQALELAFVLGKRLGR